MKSEHPKVIQTRRRPPASAWWSAALVLIILLVSGCAAARSQGVEAQEPLATAAARSLGATVEVTRIVMTERIVLATPTPPKKCSTTALDTAPEVVIAAILPLSRPASLSSALGAQAALTLAVDAANAQGGAGGRPLRLWIGDAGSTSAQVEAAAIEAITSQCASALVSSVTGEAGLALVEVAHANNVPLLLIDGMADALTSQQYPEIFRLVPSEGMIALSHADWMRSVGDYNNDGARSVIFVTEDTEAARLQAERMGAAMLEHGIESEVYPVTLPRTDFSSLIARLVVREQMPDALFIRFNGESALALHQQLLENGIGPTRNTLLITMRTALDHGAFWNAMGSKGQHAIVARSGPWPATVGETGSAFARSFARYLNRWPEDSAFAAYDAPFLFADAVTRAGSAAAPRVIDALETADIELAAGRYTFPYGSSNPPERSQQQDWAWHQWMSPPYLFLVYSYPDQESSSMDVLWPPAYATVSGIDLLTTVENP